MLKVLNVLMVYAHVRVSVLRRCEAFALAHTRTRRTFNIFNIAGESVL